MTIQTHSIHSAMPTPPARKRLLTVALCLALPLGIADGIARSAASDPAGHDKNGSKITYVYTPADPIYPTTLTVTSNEANLILRTNAGDPPVDRVGIFRQALGPDVLAVLLPQVTDGRPCLPADETLQPDEARRYFTVTNQQADVTHCEMTRLAVRPAEDELQDLAKTVLSSPVQALSLDRMSTGIHRPDPQADQVSFELIFTLGNPGSETIAIADAGRSASFVLTRTDVAASELGPQHQYFITLTPAPNPDTCGEANQDCPLQLAPGSHTNQRFISGKVRIEPGDYSTQAVFQFGIEGLPSDMQMNGFEIRSLGSQKFPLLPLE